MALHPDLLAARRRTWCRRVGAASAAAIGPLPGGSWTSVAVMTTATRNRSGRRCPRHHAIGRRAVPVQADVRQCRRVGAMIRAVAGNLGPIDILINNAGVGLIRGIDDLTEADFDKHRCQPEIGVYLHPGRLPHIARGTGAGSSDFLRCRTGGRRSRSTLQRLQGRHGGAHPGLRRPPRYAGHNCERASRGSHH